MQNTCPQCNRVVEGVSSRLVQDSCGHQKCRRCLLRDEDTCLSCFQKSNLILDAELKEPSIQYGDNHTTVITFKGKNRNNIIENTSIANGVASNTVLPKHSPDVYDNLSEERETQYLKTNNKNILNQKRSYQTLSLPSHVFVSESNPAIYTCNVCKKSFRTRSHIKYHQYCVKGVKPLKCDKCNKEFISKSHFDSHKRSHVGNRPYSCGKCGKSFLQNGKLKRHLLLHTDSRPFVCQDCGKAFRTKDTLRLHLFVHNGEKPFACKQCKVKFNNSSNLRKHLVTHSNEKVHMCDQCGKRFKLKSSLAVHRNIHSRLRLHKCMECLKSFAVFKDLQRHQLIHLDTKAYTCGICETGFKRKDNLNRHMKNTHPGKKGIFTKNNLKQNLIKPIKCSTVVDNPNAINVITAPPPSNTNNLIKEENVVKNRGSCAVPVINAPLKLAFKTSAFKNSYNIHRDYVEPSDNDVNIYEKILLPNNASRLGGKPENVLHDVCQKILTPLNYGTSFEHKKHAVIKNIKFKLPSKYINSTNLINKEKLNHIVPLQPVKDVNFNVEEDTTHTYTELKPPSKPINVTPGVIVNTPLCQQTDVHWRKRTTLSFNCL